MYETGRERESGTDYATHQHYSATLQFYGINSAIHRNKERGGGICNFDRSHPKPLAKLVIIYQILNRFHVQNHILLDRKTQQYSFLHLS